MNVGSATKLFRLIYQFVAKKFRAHSRQDVIIIVIPAKLHQFYCLRVMLIHELRPKIASPSPPSCRHMAGAVLPSLLSAQKIPFLSKWSKNRIKSVLRTKKNSSPLSHPSQPPNFPLSFLPCHLNLTFSLFLL